MSDIFINKPRVLIVDDTPINIQILGELLGEDYAIVFATSGADALELARNTPPDMVLLDVMMPAMNGYDVCKAMKADPLLREIPIIFITALSQQADEISALQIGAVDFISKPFHPEIVKLRVRNQLELKMLRDIQGRLAHIDGLTGIPNRRAFDECLLREWTRSQRSQTPLALLMIDIDYFKPYNDSHGHLAGDDCLKQVAGAFLKCLRASDFGARYGGEEFACILPDTDQTGALITAERIRGNIESLKISHGASPISPYVTVSLGGAIMNVDNDLSLLDLMGCADKMLYKAKEAGRNRVRY